MKHWITAGAFAIAAIGGAALFGGQTLFPPAMAQEAEPESEATPEAAPEDIEITEMKIGPDDAPVKITEYASFTCPHCANFHKGPFKQLKADYLDNGEGQVQFIYRDVYFDKFGLWAAAVARCGGEEKFFGISGMLYEQQKDWIGSGDPVEIAENLRKIGKVAGLEDDQLDACMADESKFKALVAWFGENAERDQIDSTPTLLINGEKHGNMNYEDLKELIEKELN